MPKRPVAGTGQINAELPTALLDELKAYCAARGEKVRDVLAMAIRRHLDNPPPPPKPPELPPLPPVPAPGAGAGEPAARKPAPKKKGGREVKSAATGGKNRGKQPGTRLAADDAKSPILPAPITFSREDWTEFRDLDRISARAGVARQLLLRVAVKELVDNALDAGGRVRFGLLPRAGPEPEVRFFVADDGPGVPGTDEEVADAAPAAHGPIVCHDPTRGRGGHR